MTSTEVILQNGVTVEFYRPSTTDVVVVPTGTPIAGTNGTDGVDGATIHFITNESELVVGLGADGDLALRRVGSTAAYLYVRTGGVWQLPGTSLVGASGAAQTNWQAAFFTGGWS